MLAFVVIGRHRPSLERGLALRSLARIGKYKFSPSEEGRCASIKMQITGVRRPSGGSFFRLPVANYRRGSRRRGARARTRAIARDRVDTARACEDFDPSSPPLSTRPFREAIRIGATVLRLYGSII